MKKRILDFLSGGAISKVEKLQNELTKTNDECIKLQSDLSEKKNINKNLISKLDACIKELNDYKLKYPIDQSRLNSSLEEIKDLKSNLTLAQKELSDSQSYVAKLRKKLADTNADSAKLQSEITELNSQNEALSCTLKGYKQNLDDYKTKYDSEQSKLESSFEEIKSLKEKNIDLLRKCADLESKISSDSAEDSNSDDTVPINELQDRIEILEQEKLLLTDKIKNSNNKYHDLEREYYLANSRIDFYKSRIDKLEEKLRAYENQPEPIDEPIVVEEKLIDSPVDPVTNRRPVVPEQLKIDRVIDVDTESEIDAREFFSRSEDEVLSMRHTLQEAIILDKPKFICAYCGQKVKISGHCTERGHASFFSHLYDSDKCDLKTTTGLSKAIINARKYGKEGESDRHKLLKSNLEYALCDEISVKKGVTEVQKEKTVFGIHPLFKWRRPDVYFKYNDMEIVLELQLSTTFLSTIVEREMFYRIKKVFMIWVFNFSDNVKFVDLRNLMMKDIYFRNHRNVFVLDNEAIQEGLKRKELILKCDWLEADGKWHFSGYSNTCDKGAFISLSDLTYNKSNYMAYYHDIAKEQSLTARTCEEYDNEKRTEEIIALLDKKYEKVLLRQQNEKLKRQFVLDALDVDEVIKEYVRFDVAIVKKDDKFGLFNPKEDREILPPIYRSIKLWNNSRYFLVEDERMKFGLVNSIGKSIVPVQYVSLKKSDNATLIGSYKDNESGMTISSIIVLKPNQDVGICRDFANLEKINENTYVATKNVNGAFLKGLVSNDGHEKSQIAYTTLKPFASGLYVAVYNGRWGLLDESGKNILAFEYENIGNLENNKAQVKKNDAIGYIDSSGHPIYDSILPIKESLESQKKLFLNEWRAYDKDGCDLCRKGYAAIAHYQGSIVLISQNEIRKERKIWADKECGIEAELVEKNKTGLLFKFGGRVAKMNRRQLQRKPQNVDFEIGKSYQVYISCIKEDVGLIYLSPIPCFGPTIHKPEFKKFKMPARN